MAPQAHRDYEPVFPDELIEALAPYLAAAGLAYRMGVTFKTAMRSYVRGRRVGDLYKERARAVLKSLVNRGRSAEGDQIN
jgi:hypothetical protein